MSSLCRQAVRACARTSTSRPAFLQCRTILLSATRRRTSLILTHSRRESSLAVQNATSDHAPPASEDHPVPSQEGTSVFPEFASLKGVISYPTLKALTVKPFQLTHMTEVQAQVLTLLPKLAEPYDADSAEPGKKLPPRDILVKAKTGTGKTIAFLVPAIESRLNAARAHGQQAVRNAGLNNKSSLQAVATRRFMREHVGALIISPTRELATQIAEEALKVSQHHDNFGVRLFVGGANKRLQMRGWMKEQRDIVVATPGRLRDLLETEPEVARGIRLAKMLVLDEVDTLLDQGFRDDIDAIISHLPPTPERQTFLFSATVSRATQQVARAALDKNHIYINIDSDATSPVHTDLPQYHTVLPSAADQIPHVLRLLAHDQLTNPGASKAIVFLPTTKMTQLFTGILRDLCPRFLPAGRGTRIYELHSQRAQQSRTSTSDAFRRDRTGASVLVTSDVSARGVDYPGVTRVIQVGIPSSTEQYVHRVGRTGRAGTKGRGDMVLLPWEIGFVTWQLTEIPLKPLTVNELKSQVDDLATKYDSDPAAFLADACATRKEGKTRSLFKDKKYRFADVSEHLSVAPQFAKLDAAVVERMRKLDEEPIQETFASLLGYYIGKSPELRMHNKGAIVQGCKDWTTQAMGLPVPPYISAAFLQRMGISDGRTKHFGKERRTHEWRSTGPHWTGRGSVKARQAREGARGAPTWARDGLDENEDDVGLRQDFGGPKDKFRDRKVYGNGFGTSRRDTESGDGFGSGRRDREDNSGSGSGWRDREDNGGFEPRRRERGDSGSFGSGGRGRRSGSGGSSFGESGRSGGGFSGFDRNRSFGGRGGSERGGSGFGSRQR